MTRRSSAQAVPAFLAFLAMGFADAAGPFVSLAKLQFSLSNFAAQLIAFTGFILFGLIWDWAPCSPGCSFRRWRGSPPFPLSC